MTARIAILGAGAWGTAVAAELSRRHSVILWARSIDTVESIRRLRRNQRYLPDVPLPTSLQITADLGEAIHHAQPFLVLAVPLSALAQTCRAVRSQGGTSGLNVIWLCKGIDPETLRLPSDIVRAELGLEGAALSGPSFAHEVASGLPAALVLASPHANLREHAQQVCHGGALRIYPGSDRLGVEVGGAVKNVMAIAAGASDGLGLGLNARAALITRGLAEITRLAVAMGAQPSTLSGLAGLGDLVLTCTGDRSRNRRVGQMLAQGMAMPEILQALGQVAEGVPCTRAVRQLARNVGVEMPIVEAVAAVLFEGLPLRQAFSALMARSVGPETQEGL